MKDTRRYCDGIRIHPYLGGMLAAEGRILRERYFPLRILTDEYNRAAIPLLNEAELIQKFDPTKELPDWLPNELKRLIRRHRHIPIWIPDIRRYVLDDFAGDPVRDFLRSSLEEIRGQVLVSRTRRIG
ncbi:hypothetical protein ABH999_004389 [Bradyrhizobium yuanmingense]|uniref:hypothetical protein n=1 Tax=Bradyrhizobium yuanmingense TaxID=108015 RepID=UPI003511B1F1